MKGKFLHANHINISPSAKKFIASQSPLPKDYELFWNTIYNHDCNIVDLTNAHDRAQAGVTDYCPTQINETKQYGNFSVKLTSIKTPYHIYSITDLRNGHFKETKPLHYMDWKDFGTISIPELAHLVNEVGSASANGSTLVHCRAGIGRTGTLITACFLKEQINKGHITSHNLDSSLNNLIISLRYQRGPTFVQTQEQ